MTSSSSFPASSFSLSLPVSAKPSKPRVRHGRWSAEEQTLFERAYAVHGKEWRLIADVLQTRTVVQVRTHAQKYFQRVAKETNTPVMSTSNKPRFQPLPYPLSLSSTHSSHHSLDQQTFSVQYSPASTASGNSAFSSASVSSASVVSSTSHNNNMNYNSPKGVNVSYQYSTSEEERAAAAAAAMAVRTSKRINIENDKKEIQTYLQKGTEEEVLAAAFLLSSVSNSMNNLNSNNNNNNNNNNFNKGNKRKRGNSEVSDFKLQWADGVLSTVH